MSAEPIELAVASLPPFMQRRMAKLSLAGARFVLDPNGICAWKVECGRGERVERYTHLALAINDTWRDWLMSKSSKEIVGELWDDDEARLELPRR